MAEHAWDEVTQTMLHDPSRPEAAGNCLQAAVASLLRLPLDTVPHFSLFTWWPQAVTMWARGRDMVMRSEAVTEVPDRLCIVGGKSPRGVSHVVIGNAGQVVWDPHPSRDGLTEITESYWFEPITKDDYKCLWFDHPCWVNDEEAS